MVKLKLQHIRLGSAHLISFSSIQKTFHSSKNLINYTQMQMEGSKTGKKKYDEP